MMARRGYSYDTDAPPAYDFVDPLYRQQGCDVGAVERKVSIRSAMDKVCKREPIRQVFHSERGVVLSNPCAGGHTTRPPPAAVAMTFVAPLAMLPYFVFWPKHCTRCGVVLPGRRTRRRMEQAWDEGGGGGGYGGGGGGYAGRRGYGDGGSYDGGGGGEWDYEGKGAGRDGHWEHWRADRRDFAGASIDLIKERPWMLAGAGGSTLGTLVKSLGKF